MRPVTAQARVSVLLLHGLCSTPDELLPVQGALRSAGYRTLPLRLPGYSYDAGAARQRASPFSQWLHDLGQEVRRQRALGQRVVLVGLSAGALVVLGALPDCGALLDGIVLMSTPLRLDGWAVPLHHCLLPLALYTPLGRFWHYRERPPYGVKNPRVRQWIERELASRRVSAAGAAVLGVDHLREHDRLRRSVRRSLPGLASPPVLALHARDDEVAGTSNVELLRRGLRTPAFNARLLPDSHHMITIDNDRAQVVGETLAFVAGLAGDGAAALPATNTAQDHPHEHHV